MSRFVLDIVIKPVSWKKERRMDILDISPALALFPSGSLAGERTFFGSGSPLVVVADGFLGDGVVNVSDFCTTVEGARRVGVTAFECGRVTRVRPAVGTTAAAFDDVCARERREGWVFSGLADAAAVVRLVDSAAVLTFFLCRASKPI